MPPSPTPYFARQPSDFDGALSCLPLLAVAADFPTSAHNGTSLPPPSLPPPSSPVSFRSSVPFPLPFPQSPPLLLIARSRARHRSSIPRRRQALLFASSLPPLSRQQFVHAFGIIRAGFIWKDAIADHLGRGLTVAVQFGRVGAPTQEEVHRLARVRCAAIFSRFQPRSAAAAHIYGWRRLPPTPRRRRRAVGARPWPRARENRQHS